MRAFNEKQLKKLERRFRRAENDLQAAIPPALSAAADALAADMKRMAPKRTGALADSIVVTPGGQSTPADSSGASIVVPDCKVAVTVGNAATVYAKEVEFGTSRAHAEPFFVPAIRSNKPDITATVKAAAVAAVKGDA